MSMPLPAIHGKWRNDTADVTSGCHKQENVRMRQDTRPYTSVYHACCLIRAPRGPVTDDLPRPRIASAALQRRVIPITGGEGPTTGTGTATGWMEPTDSWSGLPPAGSSEGPGGDLVSNCDTGILSSDTGSRPRRIRRKSLGMTPGEATGKKGDSRAGAQGDRAMRGGPDRPCLGCRALV